MAWLALFWLKSSTLLRKINHYAGRNKTFLHLYTSRHDKQAHKWSMHFSCARLCIKPSIYVVCATIVHLLYAKSEIMLSWDWSNLQSIVLEMYLKMTYSINTWWTGNSLGMCLFLFTLTTVSLTVEQEKCVLLFRGKENKSTGLFTLFPFVWDKILQRTLLFEDCIYIWDSV